MTYIYLIRHGEAEGNIYRRAQGQYQSHLTAKGLRQLDALAERFADIHLDALYSSDLYRAMETAGAITRHHDLELVTEPRLREVCMGDWEDRPWGDLSYEYPEAMTAFNDDPDRWRAPGAETFPELKTRMLGVIRELAARHEGQTIACVSHGMAIRTLLSVLLDIPSHEIARLPHGDNTAVSLLKIENGDIAVEFYNDASHLPESLSTFARQSWWKGPGLHDVNNVRFCRLDPNAQPEQYTDFYARTWQAVHGSLEGFQAWTYLESAKRHFRADPDSIVVMLSGDEAVGITELDTRRGEDMGCGWICLCFVAEPYRRQLLGVQLIGHAVSVYRRLGRKSLRLSVAEDNAAARSFYAECGFRKLRETQGVLGKLYVMEKEI